MPAPDRSRAMEHIVVALFENRSLDNVLGHLYGPEDGKTFERGHRQGPEQPDSGNTRDVLRAAFASLGLDLPDDPGEG